MYSFLLSGCCDGIKSLFLLLSWSTVLSIDPCSARWKVVIGEVPDLFLSFGHLLEGSVVSFGLLNIFIFFLSHSEANAIGNELENQVDDERSETDNH